MDHDPHLTPSAIATLPHVPQFPGCPWYEIIQAAPRNRRGHTIPFRHAMRPLLEAGLIAKHHDDHLPWALYHLTDVGLEYLRHLKGPDQ